MNPQSYIEKLDFGKESAESERHFLEKVFLHTSFFKRVQRGQKNLVLGRKGSGKTAICLKLYDDLESRNIRVSLITPRDLSRFKMSMLDRGSINSTESSLLSWKYVFFVELGHYVLQAANDQLGKNHLTWPNDAKKVRQFMVDNLIDERMWIDKVFNVASKVRKLGVKILEIGVEVEAADIQQRSAAEFSDTMDSINEPLQNALLSLVQQPIYLLVDKVDEVWDPGDQSEFLSIGLLRAAKELGDEFELANMIVFLRSDIYDSLEFDDSDKLHSGEERITWNKTNLKKLLTLRVQASTGINISQAEYERIWKRIFPAEIKGINSFEYMLQFTLMRPRDLIQLCNLCRDRAQDNGNVQITASDIGEALPQYSRWKLKDLRDEYRVQYPFLEKLFLGVFQHAKPHISREEIGLRLDPIRENLSSDFGSVYFQRIDNLLQILYNIGFLGVISDRKTLYHHTGDAVVISWVQDFEIHRAFRQALEIDLEAKVTAKSTEPVDNTQYWQGQESAVDPGSAVGLVGTTVVSGVYRRREAEVKRLVMQFHGQRVPGYLMNVDDQLTLPAFSVVLQSYQFPAEKLAVDLYAENLDRDVRWAIEVLHRPPRVEDINRILAFCSVINITPWLVVFAAVPDEIKQLGSDRSIYITGERELTELKKLLDVNS